MKHNMSVIQINGIRGLILTAGIVCCLAVGFIGFPGWVLMQLWNIASSYISMPVIGIFQGILLWGIVVAAYFTFRKNKLVVCFKSPEGLSEEELKAVFADLKDKSCEDAILKSMISARELEMKIKATENTKIHDSEKETINKQ